MSWVGPICENSEPADNFFCTQCGSKKPVMIWTCSYCNTSGLSDEWEYCIFCGAERIKIDIEWLERTIEKVREYIKMLAS